MGLVLTADLPTIGNPYSSLRPSMPQVVRWKLVEHYWPLS